MTPRKLPSLLFLHLDRTGGTSIINALRAIYERDGQTFIRTDAPVYGEYDCVAGHFPFTAVSHFVNYLAISVLRHPVERELSMLNKCASTANLSLSQSVRLYAARVDMDNYIETFIHDGFYVSRYASGPLGMDSALATLDALDLVGVTQHLDKFYEFLLKFLNLDPLDSPPLAHENSSSGFEWTPDQRQRVLSRLPTDRALYLHALSLCT